MKTISVSSIVIVSALLFVGLITTKCIKENKEKIIRGCLR